MKFFRCGLPFFIIHASVQYGRSVIVIIVLDDSFFKNLDEFYYENIIRPNGGHLQGILAQYTYI